MISNLPYTVDPLSIVPVNFPEPTIGIQTLPIIQNSPITVNHSNVISTVPTTSFIPITPTDGSNISRSTTTTTTTYSSSGNVQSIATLWYL